MMYMIHSNSTRNIKLITKLLEGKGYIVWPTKLPDYIYVRKDPHGIIPDNLKQSLRIIEFENDESIYRFLREAGLISEILEPPKIHVGEPVCVVGGMYKDFRGIVKSINDNGTVNVEISIFGKITNAVLERSQVETVIYY